MDDSNESWAKQTRGAATLATDAESGQPGDSRRCSLYALEAMLKRGVIGQTDYTGAKEGDRGGLTLTPRPLEPDETRSP